MPKIRTLARRFLSDHPKAGQPTFFVEKVLRALEISHDSGLYWRMLNDLNPGLPAAALDNYFNSLDGYCSETKIHTCRAGNHFKPGELLQLAVWSGQPYRSKQIKIAPPVPVVALFDFRVIKRAGVKSYYVNGEGIIHQAQANELAKNDGLCWSDFNAWFDKGVQGQVICWRNPDGFRKV